MDSTIIQPTRRGLLGGIGATAAMAGGVQLAQFALGSTAALAQDNAKPVKLAVVAQQDGFLAEKAVAVASDVLTAHPEVNVIYAANEGGTVGAVQAVRRAGKQGKVFVFGTDGSEQLANFLLDPDGVLVATTAQQPFLVGGDAVRAALAAIAGKPVDKTVLVPALPLSRADAAGVRSYLASLKQLQ